MRLIGHADTDVCIVCVSCHKERSYKILPTALVATSSIAESNAKLHCELITTV